MFSASAANSSLVSSPAHRGGDNIIESLSCCLSFIATDFSDGWFGFGIATTSRSTNGDARKPRVRFGLSAGLSARAPDNNADQLRPKVNAGFPQHSWAPRHGRQSRSAPSTSTTTRSWADRKRSGCSTIWSAPASLVTKRPPIIGAAAIARGHDGVTIRAALSALVAACGLAEVLSESRIRTIRLSGPLVRPVGEADQATLGPSLSRQAHGRIHSRHARWIETPLCGARCGTICGTGAFA